MKPTYSAASATLCLAITVVGVLSADPVMTWQVQSNKNHTLKFDMDDFQRFSECLCGRKTFSCTIFADSDGNVTNYLDESTVQPGTQSQFTNSYVCNQYGSSTWITCTRLSSLCEHVVTCLPNVSQDGPSRCALGRIRISWDSTQIFTMLSYDSTKLTILPCDSDCATHSTSGSAATPLSSTTRRPSTTAQPCQDNCVTIEPSESPTTEPTVSPTSSSTVSSNATIQPREDNTPASQSSDDDTGVIIGVVVAIIVCAVIVAVGFIMWWRKKKVQKAEKYGSSQLSSQPVEIISGGFNGFARQGSRGRPNAHVTDSTEPSYATVSADHVIVNGNNASYYNLKNNSDTSASAYENTSGSASVAPTSGDYRNISPFGQDAAGYEVPLPATASQAQSQSYPKTPKIQVQGDGMEYEDVHDSSSVHLDASHGYGSQFQPNDDSYEIPVNPGGGQEASDKNVMSKGDSRYESVHLKGPGMDNVYSEVGNNADNTNHDDIVPPKRNRFLQPPTQAQTRQPSVYELAQPIHERSANPNSNQDNSSTVHGPYARLGVNQTTPVNPYNCEGGNGDVYDSGSKTYFELESRASIRVKDKDNYEDSYPYSYSSAEPTEHPYEDPDKKTDKDPHYYDL